MHEKSAQPEKALAMAVTLQYAKVIDRMTVVTNLGDSRMRARLAKGTLNVLEARNVAVSAGLLAVPSSFLTGRGSHRPLHKLVDHTIIVVVCVLNIKR